MNWDRIEGNWKEFKGKAQQQWGKLTADELDQMPAAAKSSRASCRNTTVMPRTKLVSKSILGLTAADGCPSRTAAGSCIRPQFIWRIK